MKRNLGIDLLKLISMIYVIVLHIINRGGVLESSIFDTPQYYISGFLNTATYCAVDCFALVGGYVCYKNSKTKFSLKPILSIWFQSVFIGLIICIFGKVINPSIVNFSILLKSVFPLINKTYWYLNAYCIAILLLPAIHLILNNISENQFKFSFIIIAILSTISTIALSVFHNNFFHLDGGYSFIWLAILYYIGGGIKKYKIEEEIKKRTIISFCAISLFITFLCFIIIGKITFLIFKTPTGEGILIKYISPTILCISISQLLFFSNLKFTCYKVTFVK